MVAPPPPALISGGKLPPAVCSVCLVPKPSPVYPATCATGCESGIRPPTPRPPQPKPPSGNNQNYSISDTVSVHNDLTVSVVANGGSSVNVNVNQTTTINNTPTIRAPYTVSKSAEGSYTSPVYRGSNFVKPLDINLNANLGTVINKR